MVSLTKDKEHLTYVGVMKYATISWLEYGNISGEHNTLLFLNTHRGSDGLSLEIMSDEGTA